jgi:uncharacterized membrane protein YoaK (UPF0700 family)
MSTMIKSYEVPLLVLTAATGAVDGVSYLALDRVFTGNMTGNVLFLGFGLAGAKGIPVLTNIVALLTFMLGAVAGARLTRRGDRAELPRSAMVVLITGTVVTLLLSVVWFALGDLGRTAMLIITGLLAIVLGAQAAAVKHVGIRDLSTVVVTMTMVNLSTDSRAAGGQGAAWRRRIGAIVTMGVGALLSAFFALHVSGASALLVAGVLMTAGVALCAIARRQDLASTTPVPSAGSPVPDGSPTTT